MRKIIFALVCSFIAFGWIGCEMETPSLRLSRNKTTNGSDVINQHEIPHFHEYFVVEIDSALSLCGVDSIAIKSPWIQDCMNSLLADSVQLKQQVYTTILELQCFTDSLGDDYIIKNKRLLYDCNGTLIENLDMNDSISDVVWGSTYLAIYDLAYIEIGLMPCYPDNLLTTSINH